MSTAKFNQWLNSDGTENYKCRAWVNFNGTGTVAIRASGNVSSITDNGVGDYTVNFTTAMPDANYAMVANSPNQSGSNLITVGKDFLTAYTTTTCRVGVQQVTARADVDNVNVAFFR